MTALAIVARETERIELGTAVVPTYPRHPVVIAQQALTVQVASKGRFTLGIGRQPAYGAHCAHRDEKIQACIFHLDCHDGVNPLTTITEPAVDFNRSGRIA
jgi:alkanesulfonate monooxygenase SsuD/methylene tetrahydromethanopterin reductase-like flavin-dependent oxidoreductase (luciferase family)